MKTSNFTRCNSGTFIVNMFIEITKQVNMIRNGKYLKKSIKTETVITIQIVSLMSQKNLTLTEFYFRNYKTNLEAIMFFGKIVIN